MSLHNMAVLSRRGQRQAAVPLLTRAIAERSLGPEHPLLALSLSELANARREEGRYEEAEQLYRRALAAKGAAAGG